MKKTLKIILLSFLLINLSCSDDTEQENIIENAVIQISGSTIEFGDIVEGIEITKVLSIENTGNIDLVISEIIISPNFSLNWTSKSIAPNSSVEIEVTFSPTEVKFYSGEMKVVSNATNDDNYILQCNGNGISNVYEGDVVLKTQEEVEFFGNKGYKRINGGLSIGLDYFDYQTNIADLSSLSNIQQVNGLLIGDTLLENLNGLENLIFTGLVLYDNNLLENVNELNMPEHLNSLQIAKCDVFNDTSIFNVVKSVGAFDLWDNSLLINLDGFNNIDTIDSFMRIRYNPLITNLDAFANLTQYGGETIIIKYNKNLDNYCGITNLLQLEGVDKLSKLTFNKYNPSLDNILNECSRQVPDNTYSGDLKIRENTAQFNYFLEQNYEIFDGNLQLLDMENLEGLTNTLRNITGNLVIGNIQSTNLEGLENLNSASVFSIEDSPNLTDFCALNTFINNGNYQSFLTSNNAYNPTESDMLSGNCSQ